MKNKVIKRVLALSLAACLVIPALSYVGSLPEAKAADTTVVSEVGDTNSDGKIDAKELVRVKKSALPLNQAAELHFAKFNDAPLTNFVTKNAYAGGSVVTFDAYVPEGMPNDESWWGAAAITDPDNSNIYACAAVDQGVGTPGWKTCTIELPNDGGNYYIAIGGCVGTASAWIGKSLLVDNFKVATPDGTVEDDFNHDFTEGIFSVVAEGKDWQGDGSATAVSLYTFPDQEQLKVQCDLNNDGDCENADADLMRQYLVDKIYSFYRPDTSSVSNDTATYKVTDELDREMTDTLVTKSGKAVGIRYFLHLGTEETNPLYSVSNILSNNASAYASSDAWEAAGGGAVGTMHWWGKSLFGYYTSLDKWVVERDVQMLTDAGIDFVAIDTENGIYVPQLALLLEVLDKYYDQGYNVPKVTFTSDVSSSVATLKNTYSHLWYTVDTIDAISNMETVHAATNLGSAMSASAFYNDSMNHQRDFNGKKHINETDSELQGYNLKWEFENAVQSGATTILVESWNEWLSERKESSNSSQPIVLEENADMANSSDFQPMEEGYGDSYYMQLIDCIKEFKGNTISNNKLNTATGTESVTIDIDGDFKQWNKVSTHYLDYTDEIDDRDAEAYSDVEIVENNMLAFTINNVNEIADYNPDVKPSFVTKNTYAGGSKVSFKAYIPEGAKTTWWGICWTTTLDTVSNYNCFDSSTGASLAVTTGQWYECTATLPSNSSNYYIYLVGELGQWGTTQILIDDFKITSGNTTVKDDFSNGISEGLFTNQYDVRGGATLYSASTMITNQAAALYLEYANEPLDIVTNDTYPGGSVITFDAYVPKGVTANTGWWGVAPVTSQTADIYAIASGYSLFDENKLGKWAEYTMTIPDDGNEYYLGVGGACGGGSDFVGKALLIDNFKVTSSTGELLAEENFDSGLDGKFKVNTSGTDGNTCVSTVQRPTTYTDNSGRNDISRMKMTTDGSYLYALVETVDAIQGWGEANCMSLFISTGNVGGCWNQYEYVVNRDSSKATSDGLVIEKYVSGAWKNVGTATYRKEGNLMHLAIPLSALDSDDSFELEFKWADNYSEDDIYSLYKSGDVAPYGRVNYVYSLIGRNVAITVDKMGSDPGNMSFITKEAYPAGSTVTFDILVPKKNDSEAWWGIGFTTNPTTAGLYEWNEGSQYGGTKSSTIGDWDTVTVDIPSGYGDQYIYLVASVGQWSDTVFQLDNFEITNGGNVIARETFNSGYGIFNVDENAVALKSDSSSDSNQAAEIHMKYILEDGKTFVSSEAYPGGSTISFKAYVPQNAKNQWWGVGYSTTQSGNIYDIASQNNAVNYQGFSTIGAWAEYTVTLPEEGSYYFFVAGGLDDPWIDNPLCVDDFKVYNAYGELIAKDDFSEGLHNGLFAVTETKDSNVSVKLGGPTETATDAYENGVLKVDFNSQTSHVSCEKYPAGSLVTFDAYVTTESTDVWWGVDSIQDKENDIHVYATEPYGTSTQVWNDNPYYYDNWSTYTWTLDADGYISFEGHGFKTILIDNIVITSPEGVILVREDFDNCTIEDSMFEILDSQHASLDEREEDVVDIQFTAYDAPTINDHVSGDAQAKVDAAYKALAEAGFNKALALHEGYTEVGPAQTQAGSTELSKYVKWRTDKLVGEAKTALDIAAKYGLSYYVKDWSFYNLGRTEGDAAVITGSMLNGEFETAINTILSNSSTLIEHEAYAGHYATDEPANNDTDFNALKMQAKYYNSFMGANKGELYVNLNPAYEDQGGFSIGNWVITDKYDSNYATDYVQKYVNVAKNTESKINYIAWDYYPFMVAGHEKQELREENYLYNFNVMARAARDNNLGLRFTLQTAEESGYGCRAITSVADYRFQIYTGMAFGVNDFTYYNYSGTDNECIFDRKTGNTNEVLYSFAKTVNNEVHAIENIFADYKWSDITYQVGSETTSPMSKRMMDGLDYKDNAAIKHDGISSATCTADTICGIFTAETSSRPYGYMVTNIVDPTFDATDRVQMTFTNAKAVSISMDGKQWIQSGNSIDITLQPGSGAFIVPILY